MTETWWQELQRLSALAWDRYNLSDEARKVAWDAATERQNGALAVYRAIAASLEPHWPVKLSNNRSAK